MSVQPAFQYTMTVLSQRYSSLNRAVTHAEEAYALFIALVEGYALSQVRSSSWRNTGLLRRPSPD